MLIFESLAESVLLPMSLQETSSAMMFLRYSKSREVIEWFISFRLHFRPVCLLHRDHNSILGVVFLLVIMG